MTQVATIPHPANRLVIPDSVVRRAVRGDEHAFRHILSAYERPIRATVERLIAGRCPADTADVVQDILYRIHRSLHLWDRSRGASLSTWIYTLVRNFCFDVLKKRRLPTVSLSRTDHEGRFAYVIPDAAPPPEENLQLNELGMLLEELVASLPDDQRQVFELRQNDALNYRQIASLLGLSLGTVKSRLARAKENLRRELMSYNLAS